MLRAALAYPLRGPHTESVYLNGLVLAFATAISLQLPGVLAVLALVPAVLLAGYLGSVYEDGLADGTEPPAFGPIRGVARRGALAAVLCVCYLVPAAVVLAVTAVGALGATTGPDGLSFGSSVRIYAGATAVLFVVLFAGYLVPAAVGTALETGSLRAGLDPRRLLPTVTSGAYFTAYWLALGLVMVAAAVAGWLATIGGPGVAVGIVLSFHVLVGGAHLVGRGHGTRGSLYDLL